MTAPEQQPVQPLVFVGAKFTNLLRPELLSLGIVGFDPTSEFYVELDLDSEVGKDRVRRASNEVRLGGVLAQWGRLAETSTTSHLMGLRAGAWLLNWAERADCSVGLCFDHTTIFDLTEAVLREAGLWTRISQRLSPISFASLAASTTGQLAFETSYRLTSRTRGIGPHHALADAHALRACYIAASMPRVQLVRVAKMRSY